MGSKFVVYRWLVSHRGKARTGGTVSDQNVAEACNLFRLGAKHLPLAIFGRAGSKPISNMDPEGFLMDPQE